MSTYTPKRQAYVITWNYTDPERHTFVPRVTEFESTDVVAALKKLYRQLTSWHGAKRDDIVVLAVYPKES